MKNSAASGAVLLRLAGRLCARAVALRDRADPRLEVVRANRVPLLERLMNPRIRRQELRVIVGLDLRATPGRRARPSARPSPTDSAPSGAPARAMRARIDEIVDQQHVARQVAARHRDVLRDVEVALLPCRPLRGTNSSRGSRSGTSLDTRQLIADAQTAARELGSGRTSSPMHAGREQLDETVILVPAYPQVLVVVARIGHQVCRRHRDLLRHLYMNGWRSRIVSSRSGPVDTMSTGTPATSWTRVR